MIEHYTTNKAVEDMTEEELAELFAEEELETKNLPYQKTKKQSHDLRNPSEKYFIYWKSALKLVNAWARRRDQKTNYRESINLFAYICDYYHVAGIDESWLQNNLRSYRDYEAYRRKIRRLLEKKEGIISLRALDVSSSR